MMPSERRWRGSLRLIKSRLFKIRHSGTALSGEESAAPPLQIPRCYVPRHDKTCRFRLRLSTVNLCHSEPALQAAEKDLRGAKAPLYHSAAGFRDFLRSLFSREESAGRFTSPPTDPPNHLRSCTKAGNSPALAPSDLRRGNRAFSTARPAAEAS